MNDIGLEQRPKRLVMKVLYSANILLCVALLWRGWDYIKKEKEQLFLERVNFEEGNIWIVENFTNTFSESMMLYGFFMFCVFFVGFQLHKRNEWKSLGAIVCGLSIFSFLFGRVLWKKDGDISVEESVFIWLPLLSLSIILSVIAFVRLLMVLPSAQVSNDILDDPNSITHH